MAISIIISSGSYDNPVGAYVTVQAVGMSLPYTYFGWYTTSSGAAPAYSIVNNVSANPTVVNTSYAQINYLYFCTFNASWVLQEWGYTILNITTAPPPVVNATSVSVGGPSSVNTSGAIQLWAVVGPSNTTSLWVNWSIVGGGGSLSSAYMSGSTNYVTYTAGASTGTVIIRATSVTTPSMYTDVIVTITSPAIPRPSNWYWNSMAAGSNILSAIEWNQFTSRINEFRAYKSISTYYFTYVYSGNNLAASIFNEASAAINAMIGGNPTASSGGTVYASDFNLLKTNLNSL